MERLLLEGGAEFGGRMSEPDLQAIQLAGGCDVPIVVLPTAAAPDRNHERAGRNALRWFSSLGASHIEVVPVIDKACANDPALAQQIGLARLIYILGGFPAYTATTLSGSRAWEAAMAACRDGAVLGGSSAGAMVLCQHLYDPEQGEVTPGLNVIPNACVLPHHNTFGRNWAARLTEALPDALLIGIDEQTGMLTDDGGSWAVSGAGKITLYRAGDIQTYDSGQTFGLPG